MKFIDGKKKPIIFFDSLKVATLITNELKENFPDLTILSISGSTSIPQRKEIIEKWNLLPEGVLFISLSIAYGMTISSKYHVFVISQPLAENRLNQARHVSFDPKQVVFSLPPMVIWPF